MGNDETERWRVERKNSKTQQCFLLAGCPACAFITRCCLEHARTQGGAACNVCSTCSSRCFRKQVRIFFGFTEIPSLSQPAEAGP